MGARKGERYSSKTRGLKELGEQNVHLTHRRGKCPGLGNSMRDVSSASFKEGTVDPQRLKNHGPEPGEMEMKVVSKERHDRKEALHPAWVVERKRLADVGKKVKVQAQTGKALASHQKPKLWKRCKRKKKVSRKKASGEEGLRRLGEPPRGREQCRTRTKREQVCFNAA